MGGVTRYARSGSLHLAYQVVGDGPPAVLVADWFGHVEAMWEGAAYASLLNRLARSCGLIVFDKRGVGLSDPVPLEHLPSIEEWMDDVRIVMDDAEVKEAAIIGVGAGGPMAMQFAATYPHRANALVLVNSYARLARADDYPFGVPDHVRARILEHSYTHEATMSGLAGPSDDPAFRAWWDRYQRQAVSPGAAVAMREMMFDVDVRCVLSAIHTPTLVLHRREDPWIRVAHGRYLADNIDRARLVELDGAEDLVYLGDTATLVEEIQEFVTGERQPADPERVLATVLFTDIVGSTQMAAALGDRRWRLLLDHHDADNRRILERHRGRLVNPTGDGMLAVFDGPARAIRAACEVRAAARELGVHMRAGLHAGEIELRGNDVGGISVNIGSRIASVAEDDEILTSSTVRDLVAGSGIQFADRGQHVLRDIPEERRLFAVLAA